MQGVCQLNPPQVTRVIYVGLVFPKYNIEKCDVTRIFKLCSLQPENVFKKSSCGGVSVKVLILPLKHCDRVCIFLERACIASTPRAVGRASPLTPTASVEETPHLHSRVPASLLTVQTLPIQETVQLGGILKAKCHTEFILFP